jgi:predicted nucleic acid-binding protein
MIVLDASALVEILLNTGRANRIASRIRHRRETLHAPHVLDVEVAQTLRRYVRTGELAAGSGRQALDEMLELPIRRYPHYPLLTRIWELRDNVSSYDAAYLALAEALEAPLLTCDAAFTSFQGHRAKIELI